MHSFPAKRLIEADILRAMAITMILVHHAFDYFFLETITSPSIRSANELIGHLGLGIFFFISGYLLYHNNPKIASAGDILNFYRKRLLRIYPLYWMALIVSIFCLLYLDMYLYNSADHSAGNLIVHFLGLQAFAGTSFIVYWFIGLILVFYVLYPVIVFLSKNARDTVLISLGTTGIALCGYVLISNIYYDIVFFFMVFASGIMACRARVFERGRIDKYIPLLAVLVVLALVIEKLIQDGNILPAGSSPTNVITLTSALNYNIVMISSGLMLFWTASRYGSLLPPGKWPIEQIAYGSYAAYLFDPVCFGTVYGAMQLFGIGGMWLNSITLILGIPLALVVGYSVQKLEYGLKRSLKPPGTRRSLQEVQSN